FDGSLDLRCAIRVFRSGCLPPLYPPLSDSRTFELRRRSDAMPRPPDAPPSNPVAQEASMRRSPLAAVCPLLLLWTVAGCTDLFGTRGLVNRLSVRVDSALVGQFCDAVGTRAYMTIRIEGKETVLLEFPCSAVLSRSTSQ